ncbi:amino acid adenylation domain-containing protein [Gordonia sputi]|uniref:amino acid adenylation domain-containing protein n=1 Tax=Gordonia sputi TaxID=36823 RepID=UPI0014614437|nr:non-ribosomal peptide synthetase [Gordonia sputi]
MTAVARPARVPLSAAQSRMWFINRFEPASASYNIPLVLRLKGSLDLDALLAAVGDVMERHEVLRTIYPDAGDGPVQHIVVAAQARDEVDWGIASHRDELIASATTGFDVTRELPIRGRVLRVSDGEHELALTVHHIAFDGGSVPVLVGDLLAAYLHRTSEAVPAQAPLSVQYADYALWQQAALGSVHDPSSPIGSQMDYWRTKLAALPIVTDLPRDRQRPSVRDSDAGVVSLTVDDALATRIEAFAREHEITGFMVLHAALAIMVSREAATDDVVIGTPITGRTDSALADLVGMFVNTLVLRTEVDPGLTVEDFLASVRTTDIDAFAHADVNFEDLIDELSPARSTAFEPLVQIAFTHVSGDVDPRAEIEAAGLVAEPLDIAAPTAKFDLTVGVADRRADSPMTTEFIYASALFDESTVRGFADRWLTVLEAMVANPRIAVGDIDFAVDDDTVMSLGVRSRNSLGTNGVAADGGVSTPRVLVDILDDRVIDMDRPALICDDQQFTYDEFEKAVNRVARRLIAAGVGPGDVIAVGMNRSINSVVAVFGVLRTGAAYVPIAPSYPEDRIAFMLADCGATRGISDRDTIPGFGESPCTWMDIDALIAPGVADDPVTNDERRAPVRLDDLAYLIYTSGSTGRPKAVGVAQRGIANLVDALAEISGTSATASDVRVLHVASPSFDASVLEMLWGIGLGHTLVIASADEYASDALGRVLERGGVTDAIITPTVLATVDPHFGASLRNLASAGEACPPELIDRWASAHPDLRTLNLYGPSEMTVWATAAVVERGLPVTIGRPIRGFAAYVLDSRLHRVPQGVTGALYLSADDSLARGYLGRPGLTAKAFVANPFSSTPGARLYATGDLVRVTATGELEYAGRIDTQVKLRGLRIELGEIEAALTSHPDVDAAVVIGVGGAVASALAAYVVASPDVDVAAIRDHIATRLPSHMVPASLTVLDVLPHTPGGKIDVAALPAPAEEAQQHSSVAPATDAEERVAAVYAEVLGSETIGVTESYFDLGGNSLSATRVAARISELFDADITVRDVFEQPTVRGLAALAAQREPGLAPVVPVVPRPASIPLSFAQARMWVINQFDPTLSTYNVPVLLRLSGDVDVAALRAAVVDVVERHEVLRTVFPAVDGVPVQMVGAVDTVSDRLDWGVVDSAAKLEVAVTDGFDVSVEEPLRCRVWQSAQDEYVFALVAHHIAADGESMGPLVSDMMAAYAARATGAVPHFAPMPVQFADVAIWQHEVLGRPDDPTSVVARQLSYWEDSLAGVPDVLELPTDRPRPLVASERGAQVGFAIPAAIASRVSAVAREHGVTPFMVVHATLAALLSRLAATTDVTVGTPIAGRGQRDLDALVGMFVNTLVLRSDVDPGESFADLLVSVRITDLDAFAHADVPFEAVIDRLDPVRSEAFAPLTQVLLTFHQSVLPEFASGVNATHVAGVQISPIAPQHTPAKVDLTFGIADAPDGEPWMAQIVYATDLFDASTVDTIADRFVRMLDGCTADPSLPVGDVVLLSDEEKATLAALPAPVTHTPRADLSLVDLFAESVRAHHERPAVTAGGQSLDYGELDARSTAVAAALVERGVVAGDLVGVATARTVDLAVAILGVLKAGAGYLPLDTTNPVQRLTYIVADAAIDLIITDAVTVGHELFAALPGAVAAIDVDALVGEGTGLPAPTPIIRPDSGAYVIYTSGSTGKPKGVQITHRDVLTLIDTTATDFEFVPTDVWTMFHSYAFDFSVWELWGPFASGARLVIVDRDVARDPDAFVELLGREGVTVLSQTPSAFYQLIDARRRVGPDLAVRYIVFGGEALAFDQVDRWFTENPSDTAQLVNMYGITETTVHVSIRPMDRASVLDGDSSLIGRPLSSLGIHILDSRLHPVPPGVVGEIYVTGGQLARGYRGRQELTATRFVADPFDPGGERMYRTGDLARRVGDDIEYLGRGDAQVQLRGFRIEYGEVEAALAAAPGINAAAATVVDIPGRGEQLVGYVVADRIDTIDVEEVRDSVARAVPTYMVPGIITPIERLPLTANGKLDRQALPQPVIDSVGGDDVVPATPAEQTLARLVAGVLGVETVGMTDSFFALGGDSILAITLSSAARAAGLPISPRDIFEHKSVRALAVAAVADSGRLPMLAELPDGPTGAVPVSPVAAWMIELSDEPDDFADFSQSMTLIAPEGLDTERLRRLLATVVSAHPMLSSTLRCVDDEWVATAGSDATPSVVGERVDAAVDSPEFAAAVQAAHARALRELSPADGVLVSAAHVAGSDGARVVLAIHHLGVDAVSWPILIEDLITAWAASEAGGDATLRPEVTSARAWHSAMAERTADHLGEVDYWLARVDREPTDLGVTVERDRDRFATLSTVTVAVGAADTEALLTSVPEQFGGHVNDALLGALARAIRSWQRARGIVDDAPVSILVEGHGRYEDVLGHGSTPSTADLSRTVGWFTSIAPIAVDPGDDITHAVKAAKEERLGQPEHGLGFGLLRNNLSRNGDARLAQTALPGIAFNYLGAGARGSDDAAVLPFTADPAAPALPASVSGRMVAMNTLSVNVGTATTGSGRELSADLLFPSGAFTRSDIEDLGDRWAAELAAVTAAARQPGGPGLSPSDVPGTGVTQDDLDELAHRFGSADVWPMTPLQRGLHVQSELAGDDAVDVYVVQGILHLGGDIDVERLRRATAALFDHHRALRSAFVRCGSGAVVTVIPEEVSVPWEVVEVPASAGDDESADDMSAVEHYADVERRRGFDLESAPLMRFTLVRHGEDAHLIVTNHHILIDGWSGPLVLADLLALYATGSTYTGTQPGGGDFGDHVRRIALADPDAARVAWREVLAPLDGPTLVAPGVSGARELLPRDHSAVLDEQIVAGIERLARSQGATVATVLQLAWAVLLSRLTGSRVVAFGETTSGRPADLEGVASMVGLFINTVPAVVDVDPDAPVADVLARLQQAKVTVLDHQHIGLTELMALADVPLLFDTLTVHESYPVDGDSLATADPGQTGGLQILDFDGADATHYPLNMATAPLPGGQISLTLKYLPAAFDDHQVEVFSSALVEILKEMAANPSRLTADITLVTDEQRDMFTPVDGGEGTRPRLLADLFAEAVAAYGPRTAVRDAAGSTMTYAELDVESTRLARWLIARGIGAESLVGVAIGRSTQLLTTIWAVAKTGAGYVPIDPDYPAERVASMVEDSGAVLGLTRSRSLPTRPGLDWVDLDDEAVSREISSQETSPLAANELLRPVRPENTAYVIYTSGSTGRPKGVSVTHSGLANYAAVESSRFPQVEKPVVLGFASPSFDASVLEYLLAATFGGEIAYRPVDAVGGEALEQFMRESAVTHTFLTPTVLSTIDPAALPDLAGAAVGGEAVPPSIVDGWSDHVSLHNIYGPTETTISVTFARPTRPGARVLLGGPIDGAGLEVLDARLHPVPEGVAGELYVTGLPLSRGYLDRPGLTSERFVAHPNGSPGERMYRTGDVVRWQRDDTGELALEYAGRSDDQVKLRGLRIELGEIEAALAAHPAVESAVVVGVGGAVATALAGYVVLNDSSGLAESPAPADASIDSAESASTTLRHFLSQQLPAHMVPASITVLDAFPLTAVGKLDKRALPEPQRSSGVHVELVGPIEESVAGVFGEILGVENVGATDSFFDLGGDSLSATRALGLLRREHGDHLELGWLFNDPTPRGIAARVEGTTAPAGEVLIELARGSKSPLFCVHPAGGLAWFYGGFVPYLDDRPIYGLQDPHAVSGEPFASSVEEMAQRYLAEIRRVQPEGPYHLLGWSLGGYVAYAMATALRESGEEVAFLGVMDSAPVPVAQDVEPAAADRVRLGGEFVGDFLGGWRDLFDLGEDVEASSAEEVAAIVRDKIASLGLLRDEQVQWVMDSFAGGEQLVERFRPDPFDGSLLVFTATRDKEDPSAVARSWEPHVAGDVVNVDVDADHLGLANADALAVIGPVLAVRLADSAHDEHDAHGEHDAREKHNEHLEDDGEERKR